jgi:hypothetical protein
MSVDHPTERHVPVKGHRGIYYAVGKSGRKVFYPRFRYPNGQRRYGTPRRTLKAALDDQAAFRTESARGERQSPERKSLGEAKDSCFAAFAGIAPRTVDTYESLWRNHVEPFFGARTPLRNIDLAAVLAFQGHLVRDKELSHKTIQVALSSLSVILGMPKSKGGLLSTPFAKFPASADSRPRSFKIAFSRTRK